VGFALGLLDLKVEGVHPGPVEAGAVVVFGVVAVVEPEEVVDAFVGGDAPGEGEVGVSAVVEVVAVEVGEAVAEVVEGEIGEHEFPVEEEAGEVEDYEGGDFENAEVGVGGVAAFDFAVDGLGIVTEVREEDVGEDIFGLAVVAVAIDGEPVGDFAGGIGAVGVAHVVSAVDGVVEGLGEADGEGFEEGEAFVEEIELEVGVVEEVVGDAVDVPGDGDGPDQAQGDEVVPGEAEISEGVVEEDEVGRVCEGGEDGDDVPRGIGQEDGVLVFCHMICPTAGNCNGKWEEIKRER